MADSYESFISSKHAKTVVSGFDLPIEYISEKAKDWQPPLDNLTFEDWARICDKVDAKYESKVPDGFVMQEQQ